MIQFVKFSRNQQGATLLTAMIFLLIITVVGVSASRIATQDILIAGNDQKRIMIYQKTSNNLRELATVPRLANPLIHGLFDEETGEYDVPANSEKPGITERIIDKRKTECNGFGKAISLGPGGILCRLFEFDVKAVEGHSSIRDRHFLGASKEVPNASKNNAIN